MSDTIAILQGYAALLRALREHFAVTHAIEVATPVLSAAGITDPNVHSITAHLGNGKWRYLHTSPEFPMKRLLAAGSGDIYQICKVFRAEENGARHHPEFLMCEWYRVGWDHHRLMRELDQLLGTLRRKLSCHTTACQNDFVSSDYVSYVAAMESLCHVPFAQIDQRTLSKLLCEAGVDSPLSLSDSIDDWLDLTLSMLVLPGFAKDRFTFLYQYPASQAALAKTGFNDNGELVAHRFEVFFGAVELANGFHELTDPSEQRERFESENERRSQLDLPRIPLDEAFLAALEAGLPECAGVALGVDRLAMVLRGADRLADAIALGSDYDHT